ncbi:MAG TPA: IPT/TIG domain-containing protein [Thermoanaerobaculia bacterium]|nr:IPT/TIG domain-containing protein [Thermoanaerobaculia bacterium]
MWRIAIVLAFTAASLDAQQPRIDSITPPQGPIAGGTTITVGGARFAGATVKVDRVVVAPLSQSDSAVRLQMQAHDNGYAVITIENAAGIAYGEFLYVPPRLQDLAAGSITTVAGVGNYVRTFGPATSVSVQPGSLTYDSAGNLYITEAGQHRITRVDAAGDIHEFASGNFFTDNPVPENVPAIGGGVAFPFGIAIGPGGNVYIGSHSPLLRMVDVRTGVISSVAGNNHVGYGGDGGPARDALTGQVTAVASDGTNVYFIDWENTRIRRIDANGIISTYAGNGSIGYSGDGGPATSASFHFGTSDDGNLAVDPQGNLFVDDQANGAIRRIDKATGIITTFYTPSTAADTVGGVRTIAFDRAGNLYYGGAGRIVKVSAKGELLTVWGPTGYVFIDDGPITPATMRMGLVRSLAIDATDNIVFSDDFFYRVRRINVTAGRLETIAGIYPAYQNENGPAVAAPIMNDNMDIAIGPDGNLLIGDFRLRRLDGNGNLLTIAGGHPTANVLDNVPADKMINACLGIDVTSDGGIDLANTGDISHLNAGIVHLLGPLDATCAFDGDRGPFKQAHLCQVWDSARDAAGNLYIADTNNNRIRRVDAATGIITTIAGNGGPVNGLERYGQGTFCGDGGPAGAACMNTPYGVAVGPDGSVYASENWARIRRIAPNGTISTFSTTPGITKMVFGPGGYLYGVNITHAGRLDANGNFTALAGNGERGFSGDGGPALAAATNAGGQACGVAVDAEGNFYFQDAANRRIRAVRYGAVLAPPNATITAVATGAAIRATVLDAAGHPAPSVRVDFVPPAAGASCTLATPFAITDANGVAAVTCTPNCIAGTYSVTATPLTSSSAAAVSMTNSGPCRRRAAKH